MRLETTSLERGLNRRRILFDDATARDAFGSDRVIRAGICRPTLEWAMAAARHAWGRLTRATPDEGSDDPSDHTGMEVRG